MASNNAYETESVDDVSGSGRVLAPKRTTNEVVTPNETTSFNVHLDTYFSDEKVPIPDQVSTLFNFIFYFD